LYSIKFNVRYLLVNGVMYRTFHAFPTLKCNVKELHKLNGLMKNDKHIAFTELSFQPFSGKFANNYSVS